MELWDEFARTARATRASTATGAARARAGADAACVRAWTAGEDLLEHLAVLYAIEAGQPEISRTKLEGLTAHYGYSGRARRSSTSGCTSCATSSTRAQARELIERADGRGATTRGQAERMVARAARAARQLAAARRRRSRPCGLARASALAPRRARGQPPGEQDGGDRGGEVEARDAGAHRDR